MVSKRQMRRTLILELLGITGLMVPSMADNMEQLLLGLGAACAYAGYFLWIESRFSIEYVGNIRKWIYTLRFFIHACFIGSFMEKIVGEILLKGYSSSVIFLPVFLCAIYANRGGKRERASLLEVLFWFILLPLMVVLLLAAKEVKPELLVEGGWKMEKSIQVLLCFFSLEILLFFHGRIREKAKAIVVVMLFQILIFSVTIGMYGSRLAHSSKLPVVTMLQMVRLPGGFVERLDILLLAFWILSLFTIFSAYCFYGTGFWKGSKSRPIVNLCFYLGIFIIVSFHQMSMEQLLEWHQMYVLWLDLPLSIILPLLGNGKGKQMVVITLFSMTAFIVTGCSGERRNPEERAYVLAMGIEKEDSVWKVSFFMPDQRIITVEEENWETIRQQFQKQCEKKLETGHVKAMILGKGVTPAQMKKEWQRQQDYSKTILLFETKDEMKKLEDFQKKETRSIGKYLEQLAKENRQEVTIGDWLSEQKKIPKCTIGKAILSLE